MRRLRHVHRHEIPDRLRPLSYAVTTLARREAGAAKASTTWIAHIGFDFVVGQIMFPPGPYFVESSGTAGVFSLRPSGHDVPNAFVQAITIPKQNNGLSGKLLFYCRGEHYFLAQVLVGTEE
jgi:hypothetical protein